MFSGGYGTRHRNWRSVGRLSSIVGRPTTLAFIEGDTCRDSQIKTYQSQFYLEYNGKSRTLPNERILKLSVIAKLKHKINEEINLVIVTQIFDECLQELIADNAAFECNFQLNQKTFNSFKTSYQIKLFNHPLDQKTYFLDERSLFEVDIKYDPAVQFTSQARQILVQEMGFSICPQNNIDFHFPISCMPTTTGYNSEINQIP